MESKIDLLMEADRRGILPPEKKALLEEAKKRGLIDNQGLSYSQDHPIARATSNIYRPTLEMGGMVTGGILGTSAGVPTGPGAVLTGVAGAGLGYSMGSQVADRLDEFLGLSLKPMDLKEASVEAVRDVGEGATYEVSGQVLTKGLVLTGQALWKLAEKMGLKELFKKIKNMFPNLTDEGILLKAKEELESIRKLTPEAEKTAKNTEKLIKDVGIKEDLTYAQKTGGQQAAAFEQSSAAKSRELAEILKGKDAKINQEALDSIELQFKEKGGISDVIDGVRGTQAALKKDAERTATVAAEKTNPLYVTKKTQAVGQDIKSTLELYKKTEKEAINEIYKQIPAEVELGSEPLIKGLKELRADFVKKGGGSTSTPADITRQIVEKLKATKGKTITFDDLRDWKSQIGEEKRAAIIGQNPNLKLYRRLKMLENTVDETMDQLLLSGNEGIKNAYDLATNRYKDYALAFRKGTVGDVLQAGNLSEGGKVAFSDIPSRFFRTGKMDAADDLVRAVGKEKAGTLIDDYASNDLISRAANNGKFNPTVAQKWLNTNKDVLEKYGLYKKYADIIKSNEVSAMSMANLTAYNKTIASKIIGVDSDDVIRSVFGGAGKARSASVAKELLDLPGIKNNPSAINGLQASFKDFLLKQMETSAVDVAGNPIMSIAKAKNVLEEYLPAMNVLYKDSPDKTLAIVNYHKMLRVIARNKNVSFAGGSTTTEKFSGTDAMKTIGKNIVQYMAVSAGAGWKYSVMRNLWRATLGAPRRFSEGQVAALLTEAIHNPEVAKTIMGATKSLNPREIQVLQKQYASYLVSSGLYASDKTLQSILRDE